MTGVGTGSSIVADGGFQGRRSRSFHGMGTQPGKVVSRQLAGVMAGDAGDLFTHNMAIVLPGAVSVVLSGSAGMTFGAIGVDVD